MISKADIFDRALQILQQIQTQLVTATKQLNMVKAQLQGSENAKRRMELTNRQINEEQGNVRFYQGVGKMYVLCLSAKHLAC